MNLLHAVNHGYTPHLILRQLMRSHPQHANKILAAQAAGYGAETILSMIDSPRGQEARSYGTYHEAAQKQQDRNIYEGARNAAIGAAALGAGAVLGGEALTARAIANQAIRPSAILPAVRQGAQGQTINVRPMQRPQLPGPRQLPGPPQAALPYSPQGPKPTPQDGVPPTPQTPSPMQPQPPVQPIATQKPSYSPQNIDIVHNLKEESRFVNMIKNGYDVATTTAILKQILPKSKVAVLEKVPGGLGQIVNDYTQYVQEHFPEVVKKYDLEGSQSMLPSQVQETANLGKVAQSADIPNLPTDEKQPTIPQQIRDGMTPLPGNGVPSVQQPSPSMAQQTQKISPLLSESQLKERKQSFYRPNYKHEGESPEEYVNRKKLYDVVNKAAKFISEGKSFLDVGGFSPENIKARGGYSVAADVLRFMAGIPNAYSGLLDEEEQSELGQALNSGLMEALPKTFDQSKIHGAQLAPGMVWNLLLNIEPNIAKLVPPSVKQPGKKMGTTEARRFLNHAVYGVLSGNRLSNELADKIDKISMVVKPLDAIAKAAKDGNMRRMQEEMEKMMDDDYFMSLFKDEIEDMINEY